MAKVQVVMAMSIDGFLPDGDEKLMKWVRSDKDGFPQWKEKSDFTLLSGYPLLYLINAARKKDNLSIYYAEINDMEGTEFLNGLSFYNLIDELIIYLIPITYGKGIPLTEHLQSCQWKLYGNKIFKNGICRLIYRRI